MLGVFPKYKPGTMVIHKPLAYIQGYQRFYGRDFKVDDRVYVPNSETEFLLETVLKEISESDCVIDVGTGCGNIALTLKLERPDTKVCGVDISTKALEVACENTANLGVDVEFYWSNYVNNHSIPQPNIIIADLPWGTPQTVLHRGGLAELAYMPDIALFHPDGALAAQQGLIKSIQARGWKPKVYLETGLISKDKVATIIPTGMAWEYRVLGNYSITILGMGACPHG